MGLSSPDGRSELPTHEGNYILVRASGHQGVQCSASYCGPTFIGTMSYNFLILAVCTSLFALRVLGQVLVVTRAPRWLPSNEHWYSGLLPYRFLLPAQLLFLAIMTAITLAVYRDEAFFATDGWGRAAPILVVISGVYFVSMALRYVLTMVLRPERRWFKRTIPIWFHMVLAVALWAFADYLR